MLHLTWRPPGLQPGATTQVRGRAHHTRDVAEFLGGMERFTHGV